MKGNIISLVLLFLGTSGMSQAPNLINFQAVIRNASGAVISSRQVDIRISMLKTSADGAAVYVETHRDTTSASGLVSLEIGAGKAVSGMFSSIPWAQGPYFIRVETDIDGGANYGLASTTQLLSVPYAMYSNQVPIVKNGDTVSIGGSRLTIPGSILLPKNPLPSLSEGLVAFYPFNGNANDASGNGNNGTVKGATPTTDRFGNSNQAYGFDGMTNHIQVNNSASLNNPSISVSGWFLPTAMPTDVDRSVKEVVSKWWQVNSTCNGNYNAFNLSLTKPGGKPPLFGSATSFYAGDEFYSNTEMQVGKWFHFVFIHDANTGGRIYINGRLERSNALKGSICPSTNPVFIGCDNNGGTLWRFFSGKIDDIRIYRRILSDAEIAHLAEN
jgi:hypothetical protein